MRKDPLRLKILKALTDALKTISIENGYQTNIAMVVRGRNKISADDPTPSLAILEAPQQADVGTEPAKDSGITRGNWEILIKGDVNDSKEHPTDEAHYVMADVKQCLAKERTRYTEGGKERGNSNILGMGGLITELSFSPGIVRPSEENISPMSFFWLVVTIKFAENWQDPY